MATSSRNLAKTLLLTCAFTSLTMLGQEPSSDKPATPDNSQVNEKDRNPDQVTADQQKDNTADRTITQEVRKALIADKSLSTYAHNVKIITQNGTVTLKGPVRTEEEKQLVEAKAATASGKPVNSELTVAPEKK
jgi:hyperosmotically inducible periplasmic protein